MQKTMKTIGKLSVWGIILAFLIWLGKELLAYLLALLMPWIHWLLGWLVLILGIVLFTCVVVTVVAVYLAYQAWRRRREESKNNDKKD